MIFNSSCSLNGTETNNEWDNLRNILFDTKIDIL